MSIVIDKKIIDNKNVFYISWPSQPIDKQFAVALRKLVDKSRNYSVTMLESVKQLVLSENKSGHNINLEKALSIQHTYAKAKIIRIYYTIPRKVNNMVRDYKSSGNIMNISYKYDVPPLIAIRYIFEHLGMDQNIIKVILNNTPQQLATMNTEPLTSTDIEQFTIAYNNDIESRKNRDEAALAANNAEKKFVNYFRSLGIQLHDENELSAAQIVENGRAVLTPDILFIDDVFINGTKIAWIDFKNYSCLDVAFLQKNNRAQAEKYYNKWGGGALCYRYSYLNDIKIDNTMLLSTDALPIIW